MEDFYGIKRNESITNSSANEYENGRTSQKANIFRGTNTEIRKNRKINGFNNGKYKKIYKGIKCQNDKTYSDFNSSAKLHYAMEKHYSLEELDDEMEI